MAKMTDTVKLSFVALMENEEGRSGSQRTTCHLPREHAIYLKEKMDEMMGMFIVPDEDNQWLKEVVTRDDR